MKILISTLLSLILSFCAPWAHAEILDLVFLYPGGQGNQEQAQPILDSFSESLKKNSGGKIEVRVRYFSNEKTGEQYIQKEKPAGGILSQDLFQQKSGPWQAETLLKTLQLPSADGTNQYFILGRPDQPLPTSGEVTLISLHPLAPSYLKENLFPDLALNFNIQQDPNVVGNLRKIGKGQSQGFVLLDQFEYATISKLSSDWAKNIKSLAVSKKIPSAPFVIFSQNISSQESQRLKEALLKMSRDPNAQETLGLLRIKGFRN